MAEQWTWACEPTLSELFQGSSAGSPEQQGCGCTHPAQRQHHSLPGLILLRGAVGPSCSSACSAREFGNSTTAQRCAMHTGTWWNGNRGEILAPRRVCRSSHVASVGSGLYPSMLLLIWGFPPLCGFILQLGSSQPIHCNFYSSSKLFCDCYKLKNKR